MLLAPVTNVFLDYLKMRPQLCITRINIINNRISYVVVHH